jgi:hypothetical protein
MYFTYSTHILKYCPVKKIEEESLANDANSKMHHIPFLTQLLPCHSRHNWFSLQIRTLDVTWSTQHILIISQLDTVQHSTTFSVQYNPSIKNIYAI